MVWNTNTLIIYEPMYDIQSDWRELKVHSTCVYNT